MEDEEARLKSLLEQTSDFDERKKIRSDLRTLRQKKLDVLNTAAASESTERAARRAERAKARRAEQSNGDASTVEKEASGVVITEQILAEIDDEETLQKLLHELPTSQFEDRRRIRARIREVKREKVEGEQPSSHSIQSRVTVETTIETNEVVTNHYGGDEETSFKLSIQKSKDVEAEESSEDISEQPDEVSVEKVDEVPTEEEREARTERNDEGRQNEIVDERVSEMEQKDEEPVFVEPEDVTMRDDKEVEIDEPLPPPPPPSALEDTDDIPASFEEEKVKQTESELVEEVKEEESKSIHEQSNERTLTFKTDDEICVQVKIDEPIMVNIQKKDEVKTESKPSTVDSDEITETVDEKAQSTREKQSVDGPKLASKDSDVKPAAKSAKGSRWPPADEKAKKPGRIINTTDFRGNLKKSGKIGTGVVNLENRNSTTGAQVDFRGGLKQSGKSPINVKLPGKATLKGKAEFGVALKKQEDTPSKSAKAPKEIPAKAAAEEEDLTPEESPPVEAKEKTDDLPPVQLKAKKDEPPPIQVKAKKDEPPSVQLKAKKDEPPPIQLKAKKDEPPSVLLKAKKDEPRPIQLKAKRDEPPPILLKAKRDEPPPILLKAKKDEPPSIQLKAKKDETPPILLKWKKDEPPSIQLKVKKDEAPPIQPNAKKDEPRAVQPKTTKKDDPPRVQSKTKKDNLLPVQPKATKDDPPASLQPKAKKDEPPPVEANSKKDDLPPVEQELGVGNGDASPAPKVAEKEPKVIAPKDEAGGNVNKNFKLFQNLSSTRTGAKDKQPPPAAAAKGKISSPFMKSQKKAETPTDKAVNGVTLQVKNTSLAAKETTPAVKIEVTEHVEDEGDTKTEVKEVKTTKEDDEKVEEKKEVTTVSKTSGPAGGQVTIETKETTKTTTKKAFVNPELQKRLAARQREKFVAKKEQASSAKNKRMAFMQKLEANSPAQKAPPNIKRSGSNVDKLLAWCRFKTRDYEGIKLSNFSSSWGDGLAFCALLHLYLPDKIPYEELRLGNDKRRNFEIAFGAATEAGVAELLEVDDMMSVANPEPKSVMTYVSSIYKHFNPS